METLNQDSLALIVANLNSKDARNLSYTARMFHAVAKEHALKDVTLHSFPNVVKFCNYILHDAPDRLPSLHALRVRCIVESAERLAQGHRYGEPSADEYKSGATLLADVLHEVPDLRVFVLDQAEIWMTYERRIVTLVSSLCALQEIGFTDIGPQVADTLRGLKSTPRKMALEDPIDSFGIPSPSAWQFRLEPTNLSFPSVHVLSVRAQQVLPGALDLARVFPNARVVNFGDRYVSNFRVLFGPQPPHIRTVDWPSLEHVYGTGHALRWWTNAHPIHCLELLSPLRKVDNNESGVQKLNPSAEREDARTAVKHVQPVALVVTMSARLGEKYMREFFSSMTRLRYVSVEVWDVYRYQTWLPDLRKWWVSDVPTHRANKADADCAEQSTVQKILARHSELVCLKVRCSVTQRDLTRSDVEQTGTDPEDAPTSPDQALENVLASLPQWAVKVPSLRYLSLDLRETSPALKACRWNVSIRVGTRRYEVSELLVVRHIY